MAQVKNITSEALEQEYRSLTPSQSGFTEDLQASNVIIPVVQLSSSASSGVVSNDLSRALAFGSVTAFSASNSTVTLANSAGFWRIFGAYGARNVSATNSAGFSMTDGVSTKIIWQIDLPNSAENTALAQVYDFIVYLDTGESISAVSNTANVILTGSYRQVADTNGDVVYPSGFTPQ